MACGFCFPLIVWAQKIHESLDQAMDILQKDAQFRHAAISMYVVESKSGKAVFEKQAAMGLAPASCQKIITSAAAFSLLGADHRFNTTLGYTGTIQNGVLNGDLYIIGYGDPTLGSWRWNHTKEEWVLNNMLNAIKAKGINSIKGNVYGYERKWESHTVPGGWPWEDIGNYYGAGASGLNWRENQYDLVLRSGSNAGDPVEIVSTKPKLYHVNLYAEISSAAKGTGDNAYIFLAPYTRYGYVRGTIPAGENNFTISGSMPDAADQLANTLADKWHQKNNDARLQAASFNGSAVIKKELPAALTIFHQVQSPPLDSINYWFLKKSINLYGEALVKAIAFEEESFGSTAKGLELIKNFWSKNGVEKAALNIKDGSGLSPSNRVSSKALVTILQYAQQQPWFVSFYNALPEMNGIKMKDGYIGGVRSYAGYVQSKTGVKYTFCFMVNNFDGSPAAAREKIWKLLDILK